MKDKLFGWLFSVAGGVVAYLRPTVPYMLICVLAVAVDCYTAWSLSRRAAKRYPGKADGKFKSHHAMQVFGSLLKICALIALVHLIDAVIFPEVSLHLSNVVAGMFCFAQVWSVLENESSLNDAAWAKVLQRFMVDKTERHLNVKLSDIFKDKDDGNKGFGEE